MTLCLNYFWIALSQNFKRQHIKRQPQVLLYRSDDFYSDRHTQASSALSSILTRSFQSTPKRSWNGTRASNVTKSRRTSSPSPTPRIDQCCKVSWWLLMRLPLTYESIGLSRWITSKICADRLGILSPGSCGILSISDNRKSLTNCANFHRKILHIVTEEFVSKSKTFVASINQIFAGGFSDLSFGVMFSCLGHYCYSIWKKRNRRELKPKQIYFRRKLCFQLCRRP